ncbi:MAG: porin family protein [Flavobacterium sp.]|nr:porin family protein [Flavobacterium sp.]
MLVLSSTLYSASAQLSSEGIRFGVKAGVNLANVSVKASGVSVSPSSLARLTAGGFAIFPIGEKFALQPELLYSGMGYKVNSDKVKLDYISLPILAKYKFANGLAAYAGPQIGFLLSAKANDEDVKDGINSTDFGAAFGADYTLSSGINFSARYLVGLSNIVKETNSGVTTKNNAFTFTIGYVFGSK